MSKYDYLKQLLPLYSIQKKKPHSTTFVSEMLMTEH
jgi:hypothetical protein